MREMNETVNWDFGRTHATPEEVETTLAKLTPDKRATVEADSQEVSRFHAYMTLALWGVCCGFLHHPRANEQGKRTDGGWEEQKANTFFVSLFVGALFDFDGRTWDGFEKIQSRFLEIFNGLPGQDRMRCDWGAWVRNIREKAQAENFRCSVCRAFSPLWADDGPLAWFERDYGLWRGWTKVEQYVPEQRSELATVKFTDWGMDESERFTHYVFDLVRGLVAKLKDFEAMCAQERIVPEGGDPEQMFEILKRVEAGQARMEDKIDDGLGILGRVWEWIRRHVPINGQGRYEVTQEEAAEQLGVSSRTVKNWEAGSPNTWGYSREKRRSKAAFAAFVAALHRDLSTGENMMDGAGKVHLGNRHGMSMKRGTK